MKPNKSKYEGVGYYQRLGMQSVLWKLKTTEEQRAYKEECRERWSRKKFFDVDKCEKYILKETRHYEQCVNFTVYFDDAAYIKLDWAVKVHLPSACWYWDVGREYVQLTKFGLTWVLRYLLKKYGFLIVRQTRHPEFAELNKK